MIGAGIILGDDHDQRRDEEAHGAAEKERFAGEAHLADLHRGIHADQPGGQRPEQDERQHAGRDQALIQRPHDRLAFAEPHEIRADNRGDHAHGADGERIQHHVHDPVAAGEIDRGEHHGGDNGHHISLEQVGRHAGTVADIVADIVGYGRGVARIVLGNAGFDLAHEIAADIGALGEDAAAKTGEDGDQRGAEAERDQRVDDVPRRGAKPKNLGEDEEIDRDAEKGEAGNQKPGDGAGAESDAQTIGEALGRGLRGPDIGAHRYVHADIAGGAGEQRAEGEADRLGQTEQIGQQQEDGDAD